jgi:ubiquinone/menaquinone biosynthesis C-methylase UbiE
MMTTNPGPQSGRFRDVGATRQAEPFVTFLEWIEGLPSVMELRKRSYELLDAHPGATVVDVGCGKGRVVADLTERGVRALGVDISAQRIAVARRRFPTCDFRIAAAERLPCEDGTVAGYRAERVYQHLADPARALAEARRVLARGGRIVLIDQDYDMWAIDADDAAVTRVLARAYSDAITNHWIGRRYHNLLRDARFVDVAVEVRTLIYTDHAPVASVLPKCFPENHAACLSSCGGVVSAAKGLPMAASTTAGGSPSAHTVASSSSSSSVWR